MEPIFKLYKTTLQEKSHRFNFTCLDCSELIIALGTDIGSCHLYSTSTLRPFGQIIYVPNLPHANQTEKKKQQILTSVKFSSIQHEKNFLLLVIGTESGHIHLYNIDIVNSTSIKVQTIKIDNNQNSNEEITSLLWCKLEKLSSNYHNTLHNVRGSKLDALQNDNINEAAQVAAIESLKIIVSVNSHGIKNKGGKIYLLHLMSNYLSTTRNDIPVKVVNVQLIYSLPQDLIIQTSFKTHFVLISCLTKCFVLDFSTIYNMSILQEHKKKFKNNIHKHHSLPFVNGANMESMKYFINIYQIGSKPRNGYYGACFDCQSIDGCDQILSARKSGRVWVAETQSGSVRNTLRFKLPKIPNIFADSTTDINQSNCNHNDVDIVWQKEMKEKPENEDVDEKQNSNNMAQELEPEFANVSTTVCQQLGVLIPFGNWTLSYLHPKDINNEKVLNLETLSFSKYKQVSKKEKKRNGYHEKLNTFGLKVLDHNLPKLLQWYPNLGKIIDIAVLESQCCFYIIYKPLLHSTEPANASKVILGKVELCSPNESVKSLINNDKITIAIDYICAYKVRDINILENVKKILLKKTEQDHNELNVTTIHKFDVHFEETKQFYDDHDNNVIIMDESNTNLNVDENKQALQAEECDGDNKDKFTKYRRASLDYKPSQKTTLTDRRKGNFNTDSTQNMTWQPAKFDVTSAKVLGDTVGSPQVVETEHANYDANLSAIDLSQDSTLKKDKDSDMFSAKKFLSIGKKMIKEISGDLLGNSPKPSPQPPLPPTTDLAPNELENEQCNANEIEIEDVGEDRNDIITDLDSVQTIHFKQKQNIARARRKSSANQQVFLEAAEDINIDEPLKKRHKDKKKKKKKSKKKKKAEFATIDPAPKMEASQRKKKKEENVHAVAMGDMNENICEMNANIMSHTAAPGTGSILALDPDITPHEVIYDDNGMLVDIKQEVVSGGADISEKDKHNVNITKIHKLLQETAKCDSMLRRRMRKELEELYEEHSNENNEENVKEAGFAAVGLSNINYRNCRALMNKMSYLLGEYEGQINLLSDLFYKWTNKIGERLSTVLTRMLCVFISVKIDIGRECESGVFEILKKFLLILDFEWVLKLCNTHKLYATLRQLATLQYEQNHACFNRVEMEKAYLMQNYVELIKLIDRYRSPLLVLQYLPLLCEKGYSHLCYTIAVAYFPHCSPWFIRKYMYRYAMDNQSLQLNVAADEWNNIFKSYLKYLKLLFSIHVRTRCNGLLVLDLITLTLSLNAPANKVLFAAVDEKEKEKEDWPVPCGYNVATQYAKDKIALIHSENKYSDGLTKYIISIMNDRSYYIEWSYLEIVFKEYGFWKGLYKVYHHFQDIESLILLCVYLDYAQPILNLLCDLSQNKYWKNLLLALSFVYKNQNQANNRLNLEIVIKYMMRNIGATQTLLCLSDKHIVNVLNENLNNIIYKEIVQQQEEGGKRSKLISSVQTSLSNYLLSQYTLNQNQMSCNSKRNIQKYNQDITPEFRKLIETLSNIKHSSDEWTVMSSVNVRPPTQRAAAPLEKNLTDLFVQFI